MTETPSHRLFAATYDPATRLTERTILRSRREYLVEGVEGRVLNLGTDAGAMFPYLTDAARYGCSVDVHAVDPDPHMRKRAQSRVEAIDLDVEVRFDVVESLSHPDDPFDVVLDSVAQNAETSCDEPERDCRRHFANRGY